MCVIAFDGITEGTLWQNCMSHCDLWLFLLPNVFDCPCWFFLSLIRQASMAQVPDWQGALPYLRRLYDFMNRLISIHLTWGVVSFLILFPSGLETWEYLGMHIAQALMKIRSILGASEKFGWKAWKFLGNQTIQTVWLGLGGFIFGTGSGQLHCFMFPVWDGSHCWKAHHSFSGTYFLCFDVSNFLVNAPGMLGDRTQSHW